MPSVTTVLSNLINPEVMSDMISGKISEKIIVTPFARIDDTLVSQPGDTITVPQYAYIGDAVDVAEGVAVESVVLTASTTTATVKKAMQAVTLTDESVLSGYGNPVGEANNQLAKAIAAKTDADAMSALLNAQLHYDGSGAIMSYESVVSAIDVFGEELNTMKVMFVHPSQVTQLRKDDSFLSADKYTSGVTVYGEIGMIANTIIVPSKRVVGFDRWYLPCEAGDDGAELIVDPLGALPTTPFVLLTEVTPSLPNAVVGEYVQFQSTPVYYNPIVKLETEMDTEDETPALTIYMKRDTNVEVDRDPKTRSTEISVDKHYTVALSNASKVVLAKIRQTA